MEKEIKKTKTDLMTEAIQSLADSIKSIEEKIDKHFAPVNIEDTITVPQDMVMTSATDSDNLPYEYRTIINERLNSKFGASVVYRTDGVFEFKVTVPKEYSNVSKDKWKQDGGDSRLKVIENALGEIGVREWCDKIAENLGHDIMQKVHEDANKLVTV